MKESQARAEGLDFTGIYSRYKEEVKVKAAEIRKAGYRAVVCTIPPNPYSRGHYGNGYSCYVEPKYGKDRRAAELRIRLSGHDARVENIKAEHAKALAEALQKEELENLKNISWMKENGYYADSAQVNPVV